MVEGAGGMAGGVDIGGVGITGGVLKRGAAAGCLGGTNDLGWFQFALGGETERIAGFRGAVFTLGGLTERIVAVGGETERMVGFTGAAFGATAAVLGKDALGLLTERGEGCVVLSTCAEDCCWPDWFEVCCARSSCDGAELPIPHVPNSSPAMPPNPPGLAGGVPGGVVG